MARCVTRVLATVGALLGLCSAAPPASAQSRGELLYTTHCVSCHDSEVHWRANKVAIDWASLKFQVARWQSAASLGWSESDVRDVTNYLSDSIYRYARPPEASRHPASPAVLASTP
jgi:mono/diheme cytochrome c family protein